MVIYRATNLINDKVYIGQTVQSFRKRRWSHLQRMKDGGDGFFYNAIRKYGKDNFKWDVIYRTDKLDNLNRMEKYMIAYYQSMDRDFGYNLTSGGDNCFYSEESKQKMSDAQSGDKNGMYGKTLSKETKKKISESVRGEKNGFYGRKHTAESLQKMKKSKQNMSDETKLKMSVAAIARYKNPDEKLRLAKLMLNTKASAETRKKMSNSQKKRWAKIKEKENANI